MKTLQEKILIFFHERKEKRLYFKELKEKEDSRKSKRKEELEKFKELQRVPAIYRRGVSQ